MQREVKQTTITIELAHLPLLNKQAVFLVGTAGDTAYFYLRRKNMALNGQFLKFGNDEILGRKWLAADSYNVSLHTQDLDSARNQAGVLERHVLGHQCVEVNFDIHPMWSEDFDAVMSFFRSHFINPIERDLNITVYVPELGTTRTAHVYMPDFAPSIKMVIGNRVLYDKVSISLIEY